MAVSGFLLLAYLFAHMVGNLKIFLGADDFNGYAHWLRTIGEPVLPYGTGSCGSSAPVLLVALGPAHHRRGAAVRRDRRAGRSGTSTGGRRARPVRDRTMRWGGATLAVFVVWHILDFTVGAVNRDFVAGDPYHNVVADFQVWWVNVIYLVALVMLGLHIHHGFASAARTLGVTSAGGNGDQDPRQHDGGRDRGRLRARPGRVMTGLVDDHARTTLIGDPIADTKAPAVPLETALGRKEVHREAGEPGEPAQAPRDRGGHRAGRRLGGGDAGRAGLPRGAVLLPGLAAARAFGGRAGRDQRGEELPQRRRLGLPAVLRHGQGRRLPLAGVQCVPAGARCRRRSSTRPWPRACRSRASTAACSTPARSAACRSSARSTPAARPASSC